MSAAAGSPGTRGAPPAAQEAVRFLGARRIRWQRVAREPAPGAGRVRVRVLAAGICGSDLHVYETGAYVTKVPVTMGHEYCGEVLEADPGVEGLAPGDRVVGDSRVFCGCCEFCLAGRPNLCAGLGFVGEVCDGAFAEEIVIEAGRLVKISPGVPAAAAALAEPLAVCLHAARLAGEPAAGEGAPAGAGAGRTLVLGGGPVGALLAAVLHLAGQPPADIAEVSAWRRAALSRFHPGRVLAEPEGAYQRLFDTTGAPAALQRLLPAHLARGGSALILGLFRGPVPFPFTALVESEWRLRGSSAFADELPAAARLLESHWRRLEPAVSHRFPLQEAQAAFDLLLSPKKEALKVLLVPGAGR